MMRREFLKAALAASACYGSGSLPLFSRLANAAGFPAVGERILVNLMLPGGPDLRHLLPPAFDADVQSVGYGYWRAKAAAHAVGASPADWERRWEEDYLHRDAQGTVFGIRSTCGWLARMWDEGKVAIVNNVLGGASRDHAHCIDIMDQGDRKFAPNQAYHSGWGGRLADLAGGTVLALTASPRPFCYGPAANGAEGYGTAGMIAAPDTRAMTLYRAPPDQPLASSAMISRSLASYYAAKRGTLPGDSVYGQFLELERVLRAFGEPIDERLADIPVPASIEALMSGQLVSPGFGEQIRNLHDSLACQDILGMRVASLDYGGWDSHQGQVQLIEPKLADLFGEGMAFATLYAELPPDVLDKLILVIAGEFGRQLRANGDQGTDHGEGNSIIVIGDGVRGGVYGEMFPEAELARLGDPSPQIEGQTGLEHVFGAVCDWVSPGAGDQVFPGRTGAPLEPGIGLDRLFF